MADGRPTAVIDLSGVQWASSKAVAESTLSRRPGVVQVALNPVAQTATVTFDAERTGLDELASWCATAGSTARGCRSRTTCAIRWCWTAVPRDMKSTVALRRCRVRTR